MSKSPKTKLEPPSPHKRGVTNVHKIMGNKLRQLRVSKDISQQELGEKLGVSFQQIQKYEKGSNRIDAGRLIEIARVLDVDIDEFYDGLTERRIKDGVSERERYLASPEGHQLIDAMVTIDRVEVRRKIIALARTVGAGHAVD